MNRFFSVFLLAFLLLTGCDSESMMTSSGPEDDMQDEVAENTSTFRTGIFMTETNGKVTTGRVQLLTVEGGVLRVDFSEDFTLTQGPGLFVFLSNDPFLSPDAINLGSFISPQGAQMYTVPFGTTLESFKYVIVHCVPFNVTFAFAKLS